MVNKTIKIAAVLCLAGTVAACDAGAQLAVAGAVALFGVGAAAIDGGTQNSTSYCTASSGQLYTRYGDCAAGDREVDSLEYQRLYKNQSVDETRKIIAENEAARNAKTYCLTTLSNTPYLASSGKCQEGDLVISESEYKDRKSNQANNLSSPPSTPIVEASAAGAEPPSQSAAVSPVPAPMPAAKPKQQSAVEDPNPFSSDSPDSQPGNAERSARSGLSPIPDNAKAKFSGTAFFVADQGRLLTNHHVVKDCDWIGLMSEDGLHPAVKLADSPSLDLAVLKTDFEGNAVAVFADQQPEIGEDSYVAGYPLLDKLWALNFTNGIISSQSPLGDPSLLQTTAAVQHGNSGGPMFDASGHVIGVVVARLADKSAENVNFAIKSEVATDFIARSGLTPKTAARGDDLKASVIAKSAKAMVVPAICFKRG
jgi:S1-C subfamily serine protease